MARSRLGRAPSRFGTVEVATQRLDRALPDHDAARAVILPWRAWYKTGRWKALRWQILLRDGFTCRMCGRLETDTSQLVGDHVIPHRGDAALFWDETNIWCLCARCHSSTKQAEERRNT